VIGRGNATEVNRGCDVGPGGWRRRL